MSKERATGPRKTPGGVHTRGGVKSRLQYAAMRANGHSRKPSAPLTAAPAVMPASSMGQALPIGRIVRPESRGYWMGWVARDYTPERVELVLRDALAGNLTQQWELFALMEDTWPRLGKALAEVKRAVLQLDWDCEPWAEEDEPPTPEAEERAKLVSRASWTMRPDPAEAGNDFRGTIHDLLDAWGKGLSVVEIVWETREAGDGGTLVAPAASYWVHPRHYQWGEGVLTLRDERGGTFAFPRDKFLIGVSRARSGLLSGGALLRPLAWWWCAANFSGSWLLNLAQIFGLPLRWATYAPGADDALIGKICAMLEDMGSQAWAAFPAGTQLELKEPGKGSGQWPQEGMLDRADRQCDLLILGQTLTSDVGASGSRALGDVHKSVRDEIVRGAADWVASVLNAQWVPAILRANYGDELHPPQWCAEPEEQEDLKADAERIAILAPLMPIPAKWAYRKQQIPLPTAGEEVLHAPAPSASPALQPPGSPPAEEPPAARSLTLQAAMAETLGVPSGWLAPLRGWLRSVEARLADGSLSDADLVAELEAARRRLPEVFADMDHGALADVLAAAGQRAAARVDPRAGTAHA